MSGGHLFFSKIFHCIKNDYYLCTRNEAIEAHIACGTAGALGAGGCGVC